MRNKFLLYVQIRRKSFKKNMYRLEKYLLLLDRTVCNSEDDVRVSISQIQEYCDRMYGPAHPYNNMQVMRDGKDIVITIGIQGYISARFLSII